MGRQAFAVQANVGCAADVDRMFGEVIERFPRLDILVNNAGVQTWKPLLDLEEAEWDRTIDTNLKGCFLCTQRAARRMKEQAAAASSTSVPGCNKAPFPNLVDYTASKGGIEMFTKVAAVELGHYRITVNCVAPGADRDRAHQARNRRLRRHLGRADAARARGPARRRGGRRWLFCAVPAAISSPAKPSGWMADCSRARAGRTGSDRYCRAPRVRAARRGFRRSKS